MSEKLVTLTIDDVRVTVPVGTLIVDAAKKVGIDIPVFCYHPKLKPVGMCRMCLVEIGRPRRDRASGQMLLGEDGQPLIDFDPKLETACTTPVGEGWVVRGLSENVRQARREVLELLLTSHPLDCPVCDKGGECPLQNLTMLHGPGKSRFLYADKMHLAKHVPLGDLIFLDRERCIQCGRCVRFQDEIVGEPVIGFSERGRRLEIVTFSQPGFDSVFSGNTSDICPVGALTTADFRFEARPWELKPAASICTHCPVGCNLTLNSRRQPNAQGQIVVQRVMPRQNEAVNEIWICDKGRFAHHFASSPERLARPLVRQDETLVETSWDAALDQAAEGLRRAEGKVVGVAGGRASNEDLFHLRRLVEALGGRAVLAEPMAGGDMVQQVGAGSACNLGALGRGDAVLVLATDLQAEAPIWWLRLKQAADRGAALVVAHVRPTKLDRYATQVIRYGVGQSARTALGLLAAMDASPRLRDYQAGAEGVRAGKTLREARHLVVFYGSEGVTSAENESLARACASLLTASGHAGQPGSGLVPVWPKANTQGAWDLGIRPAAEGLAQVLQGASAALVMAADPAGDDPEVAAALDRAGFVVVQELFLTETARKADVVLPAQAFTEREGSFTSGERRVQRFYPAVPPRPEARPDWQILAEIGVRLGVEMERASAAAVMQAIAQALPDYAEVTYQRLAQVCAQWPIVGGDDLYYGGTAYRNEQGLGVKLAPAAERGSAIDVSWMDPPSWAETAGITLVPVSALVDRGTTVLPTRELDARRVSASVGLAANDARRLGIAEGDRVELRWGGRVAQATAQVLVSIPPGMALVPRSAGIPIDRPAAASVQRVG
jgi:NADH-quinone oxidoreductase subunit G